MIHHYNMKKIKTYNTFINESLKDKIKGKSDVELGKILFELDPYEILKKSLSWNYIEGFKYLIDNDLMDKDIKYILEKYILNIHHNEMKDYEKWLFNELNDLTIEKMEINKIPDAAIRYMDENGTIFFQYTKLNNKFYYNIQITEYLKKMFGFNRDQSDVLIKFIIRNYFGIELNFIYPQVLSSWINVRT